MSGLHRSPDGRPDRPRTALVLLAIAGAGGLTTPQLVDAAGEADKGARLSWYAPVLRLAEDRGWVIEMGRESGGWQKGKAIRWGITDAGIARLAEYDKAREHVSRRAASRASAEAKAVVKAGRAQMLESAAEQAAAGLAPEQKYALAEQLRAQGCTLQEIGDVFSRSREWIRIVLRQGTWHARPVVKEERP